MRKSIRSFQIEDICYTLGKAAIAVAVARSTEAKSLIVDAADVLMAERSTQYVHRRDERCGRADAGKLSITWWPTVEDAEETRLLHLKEVLNKDFVNSTRAIIC